MKLVALGIALTAALTEVAHRAWDTVVLPRSERLTDTLPSVEAVGVISLGYRQLAADYYWLRAISHFGDKSMHQYTYPNLAALTERVVTLDPDFAEAYFFAGTALTLKDMDPRFAMALLEQGVERRPDDWRIPFLAGFTAYHLLGDFVRGAKYLGIAAQQKDAPPGAGLLATRLAAHAARPEVGLELIEIILPTLSDETLRQTYLERRKLLLLELYRGWLAEAAGRFGASRGRPPQNIAELIAPDLMRAIPEEPLGGSWSIGTDGRIHSSHDAQRLELPAGALPEQPSRATP